MNEETRDSVLVSDRSSLLVTVENEDPVTGYPFETIGVRERLIGIFQQAIDGGRALVFINGDIDNLKTLNDSYGYSFANQAIKETVQQKEACLLGIDGAEVYVYRPQAGGDEFKAIVVVEQKPEEGINALIQLIKEKFLLCLIFYIHWFWMIIKTKKE